MLVHSRLLERGLLPYIVASQTVPILAIAPMVVIGLGSKGVEGWKAVAVLAAYLTFFPVAINALRGLQSADPRAFELMESYASSRWRCSGACVSRVAAVPLHRAQDLGDRERDRRDHRRDAGLDPGGLGGAIVNFNQYYSLAADLPWATNIVCAALGLALFGLVALAERLVLRRAPENLA